MKAIFRPISALLILALAALACVTQPSTSAPSTNVETVVAQTMQALTLNAPNSSDITPSPQTEASSLLPFSLYYLNNDTSGYLQVYRLEKDGKTVSQITFEPTNVDFYDVSPKDGSVAYTSNNQLLLVNADGSDRRVLVDGGHLSSDESYINSRVNEVAWSPNGETVAFGFGGLNLYALNSGAINKVLENQVDNTPGFPILREGYSPVKYSPDGSKLLITIGYYEGGVYAIYYISGSTLVRSEDNPVSCCDGSWNSDGSAYYAASSTMGMFPAGLWRIGADGKVTALISNDNENGPLSFVQAPLPAPDGQLYYMYDTEPSINNMPNREPLYMVRSALDGVSGRTNLVPTPFDNVNDILWAPDASFVILAIAPVDNIYQGGKAEIHYTDGSPTVPLVPFARDLRWGP